jgi:predicted esterase
LLPLAARFGPDLNVLSVRGNVLEGGMPRFFRRLGMGIFDEQDVQFRTHELVHFLNELAVKEGFDVTKVVALGYSNGANIAGGILLLYPEWLAGAVLLRPMQPLAQPHDFKTTRQQPVFFSSGKQDPTVNPAATDRYSQLLATSGFQVSRHDLDAGHNLTQQDLTLAVQWYQSHFAKSGVVPSDL